MAFYLHGVHTPHRKHTAGREAERMSPPASVTIPTSMHIGKPARPVVKVGDEVKVGTLLAEQDGFISSPVYSSVSGKVTKIADLLLAGGNRCPAITVTSDGKMTPDENLQPPTVDSKESLVEAIRKSGIVGLGGAGFPTYVKFNVDPDKVDYLIVNGAECEPYITSDSYTMEHRTEDISVALEALKKHLTIKQVIFGIENNKKAAIESIRALSAKDPAVSVKVLPPVYPQGGEKVLVYHTTGRQIPTGKLPLDVGCIVCNCTTLAAIGHYLRTGMPLVEKCVTVDGGAVAEPKNVIVPIGASAKEVFDFCGGLREAPQKLLYGGPMMGITMATEESPILKNTNAILALTAKEARIPRTTACIRCGSCTNTCPFGLNPASIGRAYAKGDVEALEKLGTNLCMECGCCSFVCPANRPLVQQNKLSKGLIREAKAKEASKQ